MFKSLTIILATLTLAACSTAPKTVPTKDMSTTINRNGLKIEWSCQPTTKGCENPEINAIEVVGYAPIYANTNVQRERAISVAHDVAIDKLVRFIKQDLTSSRTINTLTKNVEKATISSETKVASDEESVTPNISTEAATTVVEYIKTNATGIVRGAMIVDEKNVDQKTMAVTIRWTSHQASAAQTLNNKFFK